MKLNIRQRVFRLVLSQKITRAGNIAKFFISFGEWYKSHFSSFMAASKNGIFAAKEDDVDLRKMPNPSLAQAVQKMVAGESDVASVVIEDEEYFLAYASMPASGWSFGTIISRGKILEPALAARKEMREQMNQFQGSISQLFVDLAIGFVVLFGLLSVWMFIGSSRVSRRFVEPIQQLSKGVHEISGGNLDKKVDIKTGDELEELVNSFNNMTVELKNYMANLEKVTAAEERIATEFDDLAAVMTLANNQLCQGNDEMMFITVFMAMLDLKTGKLIYVNGGHNPPLVYREDEKNFHYIDVKENCVLGLMDDMDFEQQEVQINHLDILYLYTYGVTEAMSETREQYGEESLENCLNNINHQCKLKVLLEGVSKSLAEHVQDAEQSDDITMLSVRFV